MSVLYEHREADLKELQTKEAGDLILQRARSHPFPRHLPEFKLFEEFMAKSELWNSRATSLISAFKEEAG